MLMILSPAKTLNFDKQRLTRRSSTPVFLDDSQMLIDFLRRLSAGQLAKLMAISGELAAATHQQFADWSLPFTAANAKQAVLTYRGNAYVGLNADEFSAADFGFAQKRLRILSGLHGVLRPLDLIQPYRLEMAAKLKPPRGKNLYEFWGDQINQAISQDLKRQKSSVLLNLASNEYFRSIKPKQLDVQIVTPDFKELRQGKYKSISTFAKKARGLMASYIVRNRLTKVEDVKSFDAEGYRFNVELSSETDWIFTRESA